MLWWVSNSFTSYPHFTGSKGLEKANSASRFSHRYIIYTGIFKCWEELGFIQREKQGQIGIRTGTVSNQFLSQSGKQNLWNTNQKTDVRKINNISRDFKEVRWWKHECVMGVGDTGLNILRIRVHSYTGNLTVMIDVGVYLSRNVVASKQWRVMPSAK